jgi:nitrate reductase NapA
VFYGSGRRTEETYFFQKIMRGGLQSNNVEGNPRLCMASAVGGYMSSFGADEPIGGYSDLEKAHCFFIVGSNTARPARCCSGGSCAVNSTIRHGQGDQCRPRSPRPRGLPTCISVQAGYRSVPAECQAHVIVEEELYDAGF